MAKKIKLNDIATYCDVSIATVSRVINNTGPVKKDLKDRIENAIHELGYIKSKTKPSVTILKMGLLIPDIINPFMSEIANAALEEATRRGFSLVLFTATQELHIQRETLLKTRKWSLDGLIVVGTKIPPKEIVEFNQKTKIPVVISRMVEIPELPCILIDYESGTTQVIKHLLSLGHKRIACISGLPEWFSEKIKLNSMHLELKNHGRILPDYLYTWCYPNISEAVQAANRLLTLPVSKRPTAIFAFDDLIAIGILYEANRLNIRIPEDLSIVGFNDIDYVAYTNPPLSTVALPTRDIGQTLVRKMCEHLHNDKPHVGNLTELKCKLTIRESTAPPPKRLF